MPDTRKTEIMTGIISDFIRYTAVHLPDDVMDKLKELRSSEENETALQIYDVMFENLRLAEEMQRPICQDTGFMQFLVKCGSDFPLLGSLEEILTSSLKKATEETPLRLNVVETFSEENTGTNTGTGAPTIWWEIVPGSDKCEIYTYPAGGGSSMPGAAAVLTPGQGYAAAEAFVLERVKEKGPNACPPLLVGVGIGNSAETAAHNAKHALLRPVNSQSSDKAASEMEKRLERTLNESGIGPQGLGGSSSVYGVNVVNTARHPACMGVAVATGCWVHRRGHISFDGDLNYKTDTHSGFNSRKDSGGGR